MKCPYCIEDINDQAVVCPRCQRDLLFFRTFENRLQTFDTRIGEINDQLSRMTAALEDLATGSVVKETVGVPPAEIKPDKLSPWRLVGIVSLAVVLSSLTLLGFGFLEDKLVSAPYQSAVENYYTAVVVSDAESRLAEDSQAKTAADEIHLPQERELDRLRRVQLQTQLSELDAQFSHRQKIMFFLLIPALMAVPLAFGLWLGIRLAGVHFKYYLFFGLSSGLIEALIWSVLLWSSNEFSKVELLILVGLNMLRTTIGFVVGGLLGDWIERKRRPGIRRAGLAEQLAVKLLKPRTEGSIQAQGNRGSYDVRLERVKNTLSALAPVIGLIGIITPAYLGYKQIALKSQTESTSIKAKAQAEAQSQDEQLKNDAKKTQPPNTDDNSSQKNQ